jgi:hypothetical protein
MTACSIPISPQTTAAGAAHKQQQNRPVVSQASRLTSGLTYAETRRGQLDFGPTAIQPDLPDHLPHAWIAGFFQPG